MLLRRLRHFILNLAIRSLIGAVDSSYVFTCEEKTGVIKLRGEQLSDLEVQELKAEVASFSRFRLWKIFHETLRQTAIDKAISQSTDFDQVLAGKMMLYNLLVQKMVMEAITKAKVHGNHTHQGLSKSI